MADFTANRILERVLVFLIAVNTFLLSLVLMAFGLYGIFLPALFGFWGLINAFALLFSNVLVRKSALVWHMVFVGSVLVGSIAGLRGFWNAMNIKPWAVVDIAAVFYLAKILGYLGTRANPKQ